AGDEFVILLEQLPPDSGVAVSIAQKIVVAMAEPFVINGNQIECCTSIGISCTKGPRNGSGRTPEAGRSGHVCRQEGGIQSISGIWRRAGCGVMNLWADASSVCRLPNWS